MHGKSGWKKPRKSRRGTKEEILTADGRNGSAADMDADRHQMDGDEEDGKKRNAEVAVFSFQFSVFGER
jgi:hypothetical protein